MFSLARFAVLYYSQKQLTSLQIQAPKVQLLDGATLAPVETQQLFMRRATPHRVGVHKESVE